MDPDQRARILQKFKDMDDIKDDRDYESLGYPPPVSEETPEDAERWKNEFENEYGGRPDDPALQYDRDKNRKY